MRISDWSSDVFSSDLKNSGPMHHPVNVLGLFHKVLNNSLIVSMLTKKSRHSNKCVIEQPGTKRKFLFIRIGCPASLIEKLFNILPPHCRYQFLDEGGFTFLLSLHLGFTQNVNL